MPSGTLWSNSGDTHQVVEISKETSTKTYGNVIYQHFIGYQICLNGDILRLTSYGINISQLICFAMCCTNGLNFHSLILKISQVS